MNQAFPCPKLTLCTITEDMTMTLSPGWRNKITCAISFGEPFGKPATVILPPTGESVKLTKIKSIIVG